MKDKLVDFLSSIFGACLFVAVFIGAVSAVVYAIGFVAGGQVGAACAIFGATIMNWAIPLSAAGSVVGMLGFYIQGTHELTMDKKAANKDLP